MGFGGPARPRRSSARAHASRGGAVPPEGFEPPPATFVASCPILGTVAKRRARTWPDHEDPHRPARRGEPGAPQSLISKTSAPATNRRPLTRTDHLRGGDPVLARSVARVRYLRSVIVTVIDIDRPERSQGSVSGRRVLEHCEHRTPGGNRTRHCRFEGPVDCPLSDRRRGDERGHRRDTEGPAGLEPATRRLTTGRSTIELRTQTHCGWLGHPRRMRVERLRDGARSAPEQGRLSTLAGGLRAPIVGRSSSARSR